MKPARVQAIRCAVILTACLLSPGEVLGQSYVAGYTTNDEQVYGPSVERIANDTLHGIHIAWRDALSNAVYNFLDQGTNSWRWAEGTPVFPLPASLGNIEINPTRGTIQVVGTYYDRGLYHTAVAEDTLVGAGNFTGRQYPERYSSEWTLMAIVWGGIRHYLALGHDTITYHRGLSPTTLGRAGYFPSHYIAGSRHATALVAIWTRTESPDIGTLFLRRSASQGYTWLDTAAISRSIPDARRNTFLGGYAQYDDLDRYHVVCNTYDGSNRYSSAIWHYCPADTPQWSLVHEFSAESASGRLPARALIAGRPTLGENPVTGDLFVVWEQFDPANVELATGMLRSDVWAARSQDQGLSWAEPVRLTEPDPTSKRYPSLARLVDRDLHITYLADSISGPASQGQGRVTRNPVIYLRVPADRLPEAVREAAPGPAGLVLAAWPNPTNRYVRLLYRLPFPSGTLSITDCAGRLMRVFRLGRAGEVDWSRAGPDRRIAPAGVYFGTLRAGGLARTIRLVLL